MWSHSNFFQDGSLAWEALDYLLNEERVTDVQLEQKTYHGYHTEEGKKEKAEKEAKIKKDKNKSKKKVKKEQKKKKDELQITLCNATSKFSMSGD